MSHRELPLRTLNSDLEAVVQRNEFPSTSQADLLQLLCLDGDKPDGFTLLQRLVGDSLDGGRFAEFRMARETVKTLGMIGQLLARIAEEPHDPAHE